MQPDSIYKSDVAREEIEALYDRALARLSFPTESRWVRTTFGATHLLVAGLGLEGPVHSTMRGANDMGYECLLVLDASAPLAPDLVGPSRSMVEMSGGIFGAVGATADVLAALRPLPTTAPAPALAPEVPTP